MNHSIHYKKHIWILLLTTLLLRVIGMWLLPLTDTTEARYSEIARKMAETDNWVTPLHDYNVIRAVCETTACVNLPGHDFGLPFWAKPPLSTWSAAASMKVFGVNEFSARLPSLLFSIALLCFIYYWVKSRSSDLALAAIAILSTSLLFFGSAGLVMTDLALIFCSTLAMVSFWKAVCHERKGYWGYLFFVSLGLGLLAKGPLILVLVALPTGAWTLLHRHLLSVWQRLPWITGTMLALAIAAPWYWLAETRTPGFFHYFIVGEHFSRFLISGWQGDLYGHAHSELLGTIWLYLTIGFLPWFGLLILLAVKQKQKLTWRYPQDQWLSYLLLWTLMPVVFFTFAHNIIPPYALPAMPAGAILLAEFFTFLKPESLRTKGFFITCLLTPLALLVCALAYFIQPNNLPKHSEKDLVRAYLQTSTGQHSQLWYFADRRYSSDFYSGGRVKILKPEADIAALKNDHIIDYIAIDKKYLSGGQSKILLENFKEIGTYSNIKLYQECNNQPDCGQP